MKEPNCAVEAEFKKKLAEMGQIALIWSVEDVQETAKEVGVELTPEECWEILEGIEQNHNAEMGVNWNVIWAAIEEYKRR